MPKGNIYVQANHTFIIDGVPVNGFAEGDYIGIKVDGNAAARTQGGDGASMNISVPQGGVITVNLLPTSPILGVLYALYQAQKRNPRMFSIVIFTGTLEVIRAAGCAFGDMPNFQTGGPTQQPRPFSLECLELTLDESLVETILGGFVDGLIG
jgi:hypothetical protein